MSELRSSRVDSETASFSLELGRLAMLEQGCLGAPFFNRALVLFSVYFYPAQNISLSYNETIQQQEDN